MNGDSVQYIGGTGATYFGNITFNGTSAKILEISGCQVKGLLTLDAVLKLNNKRLIIDNSSPDALQYTGYIISEGLPGNGYGELQWNIGTSAGNYSIPFADSTGTDLTLPIQMPGLPLNIQIKNGTTSIIILMNRNYRRSAITPLKINGTIKRLPGSLILQIILLPFKTSTMILNILHGLWLIRLLTCCLTLFGQTL
ncbi:MAG: hypothetical protein HY738_10025 [Bacteroidia bacterium]|nr:hypothetical protein [Bacteroidia bacterium]